MKQRQPERFRTLKSPDANRGFESESVEHGRQQMKREILAFLKTADEDADPILLASMIERQFT